MIYVRITKISKLGCAILEIELASTSIDATRFITKFIVYLKIVEPVGRNTWKIKHRQLY
jgi:hypothetical protein